jgi:precorrin-6x reductase
MNDFTIPLFIECLQELNSGSIKPEECLDLVSQILESKLNTFGVVGNIHNYAQIVFEYSREIQAYYDCLSKNEPFKFEPKKIIFTEDSISEEIDHAVLRASSGLCIMTRNSGYDEKITAAAITLKEYIEKMNLYSTDNYIE